MADKKISDLTAITSPADSDVLPVTDVSENTTKKITIAQLRNFIGGPVTPTGTVNGSNASFTVASQPTHVVSDGIYYVEGQGYSYSGGTITMDIPPSLFIRAFL